MINLLSHKPTRLQRTLSELKPIISAAATQPKQAFSYSRIYNYWRFMENLNCQVLIFTCRLLKAEYYYVMD